MHTSTGYNTPAGIYRYIHCPSAGITDPKACTHLPVTTPAGIYRYRQCPSAGITDTSADRVSSCLATADRVPNVRRSRVRVSHPHPVTVVRVCSSFVSADRAIACEMSTKACEVSADRVLSRESATGSFLIDIDTPSVNPCFDEHFHHAFLLGHHETTTTRAT